MEMQIKAALSGPELKKTKVKDPESGKEHEFNIKAVSYQIDGQQLVVHGQLSHCLAGRPDDQLWYAFAKTGNQISPNDPAKCLYAARKVEYQRSSEESQILQIAPKTSCPDLPQSSLQS